MKVTKTYSIEEGIYQAFDTLTSQKNINKSSFIEDSIKKFLRENDLGFVDKLFCNRSDPSHTVKVMGQDNIYYRLSDGSQISKILFMQIFKEVEQIYPDKFFNVPVLNELAKFIKNMDTSKMNDHTPVGTRVRVVEEYKELANSINKPPNRFEEAMNTLRFILQDIENGTFKKQFKTSAEIQNTIELVQKIANDDYYSCMKENKDYEFQDLKFKVLSKLSDLFLGRI